MLASSRFSGAHFRVLPAMPMNHEHNVAGGRVDTRSFPLWAVQLLDRAVSLVLLRRVGGGYVFIHRMLPEYFAELPSATDPVPPWASTPESVDAVRR